jgi:hypothetical protein
VEVALPEVANSEQVQAVIETKDKPMMEVRQDVLSASFDFVPHREDVLQVKDVNEGVMD